MLPIAWEAPPIKRPAGRRGSSLSIQVPGLGRATSATCRRWLGYGRSRASPAPNLSDLHRTRPARRRSPAVKGRLFGGGRLDNLRCREPRRLSDLVSGLAAPLLLHGPVQDLR